MSLKFPNLPQTLNPIEVAELKIQDPREYFREWYTDSNGIYIQAPEWFYDACDWRQKPGAPTDYVHPPRRPKGKNGRLSSTDRTTFHPALAEYSNENPPHILYLWDRLDNSVPKSWPLPPILVDAKGDVITDTDPESGRKITCRFWGHAPEQISRSPDLWLMEYLERVDSRMQRRDWIALMRSSEVDGGYRPKANRINNVLSEYRKRFNMQPWKPSAKSAKAQQKLIDSGEIKKPSSGNSTRGISPGPKDPSRPWNRRLGRNYIPYPLGFDPDQYGSWNPWVDYKYLCHKKERTTKRMFKAENDCDDNLPLSGTNKKRLKKKKKKRRNTLVESDQNDEVLDSAVQIKSPHTPFSQQTRRGNSGEESSLTSPVNNEVYPSSLIKESCDPIVKSPPALQSPVVVSQQPFVNMASIAPAIELSTQNFDLLSQQHSNQFNLPSAVEIKCRPINIRDSPQLLSKQELHERASTPIQSPMKDHVNSPFDVPRSSEILNSLYRYEHKMTHPSPLDPREEQPIVSARTALEEAVHWPYQDSLHRIPVQYNSDVVNDLYSAAGVHPDQLSRRYHELDKAASENHNLYEFF